MKYNYLVEIKVPQPSKQNLAKKMFDTILELSSKPAENE